MKPQKPQILHGIKIRAMISAVLLIVFSASMLQAQNQQPYPKMYMAWVSVLDQPTVLKGFLYQVNDSSITLSGALNTSKFNYQESLMATVPANRIKTINLRRKSSIIKGMCVGVVSGFVLGVLIGLSEGGEDNYLFEVSGFEKGIIYGFPLSVVGAGIGAALGSFKVKFTINGNQENYMAKELELRKYAIK